MKNEKRVWWRDGVVYHLYVRSFSDSNHDGIGDIQGIIENLSYLADLGVEAVWLSPVFSSPNIDYGYDVSDFLSIDPDYGTLNDFQQLITAAHDLNIRVIMDLIMNHTSDKHPWFEESRASVTSVKRDWYIWKEGRKNRPPNNWRAATGGSSWTLDPATGQYYLHSFFPEQPDLNWRNPELAEAFFAIIRYWLSMGVDGFRLDVINLIAKDKTFRNNPQVPLLPFLQRQVFTRNRGRSYKIVKKLRRLLDEYENRMTVGEIYVMPPGNSSLAASYLGKGDNSLNLAFDFSLIFRSWNAQHYFRTISTWQNQVPPHAWPCNVLSNHDLFRSIDRVPWRRNKTEKAKVAAVLLLTLRGTPFIYYGEEIGMRNSRIPREAIKDSFGKRYWPFFSGRDKARTPMQWSDTAYAGFSDTRPWLPVDPGYPATNVQRSKEYPSSLFHVYRSMIHLRRSWKALQTGNWIPLLKGKNGVLCYVRREEQERIIVILNFTNKKTVISLQEHLFGEVLYSTHRKTGDVFYMTRFRCHPFEASVLLDSPKAMH